jgi:hypothetical protein
MMYAVVRVNQYETARLANAQAQLDEFQALHDRQELVREPVARVELHELPEIAPSGPHPSFCS